MSNAYLVKPDRKFAEEIIGLGGESLKQCFQCATCSVACQLSPDRAPFPRKEMIWAQWGLKDKLLGDPDIWLCHRCSDCTVRCPRGAAPGDVLAALRDYTIRHYSFPKFMGKAFGRPALLPLLLGVPALMMLVVLWGLGTLRLPEGEVEYGRFFQHVPLQVFFGLFAALMVVAAVAGVRRFWKDLGAHSLPGTNGAGIGASIAGTVKDILTHAKFRECDRSKGRYYSHLLTFYGFAGLFVTTIGVVASEYIFHFYPLPMFHPLKIFGNLSTLAMLIGVTWIIIDRTSKKRGAETSNRFDWTFIGILYAVIVTGTVVQFLRFADVPPFAYPAYVVHLVVVFALLMYLPYSRFAHMLYRTVALVHARHTGREEAASGGGRKR